MDEALIPNDDRLHYSDQRLRRDPDYEGRCRDLPEDQAEALLIELLGYFGGKEGFDLPPPPLGLPGTNACELEAEPLGLLQMGFDYFVSVLRRQIRNQVNLHAQMRRKLTKARRDGEETIRHRVEEGVSNYLVAESEKRVATQSEDHSLVYFIASESGPIKIGIANNPENRLKTLQTAHHERLRILATREGGFKQEYAYHQRFARKRLAGEWFERCPEIEAEIARLGGPTS